MIAQEFSGIHKRIDGMATKKDLEDLRAELLREMVTKSELQHAKEEILKALDHEIMVIERDTDARLKNHDHRIASVEKKVGVRASK